LRTSSQIAWNTITKWGATLAHAGVRLLLVPFLLWRLDKTAYGLIGITAGIIALTTIADLGLRGALTRQLSAEAARGNWRRFNQYLVTALTVLMISGLIAGGVCITLAPVLGQAFNIPDELMPQGLFLIRFYASAAFVVTLVRICFSAVLSSYHRYDLVNYVYAGMGIVRGALICAIMLPTDSGLYGWSIGSLSALILASLVTYLLARKICPHMRIGGMRTSRKAARTLFRLGGLFFIIKLIGMLGELSDPFVLTLILGPAAVALYYPIRMLSSMGRQFVMAMAGQLHPLATRYHVTGERARLQLLLVRTTRYTFLMGIPICVFLSVFALPIVHVWLGEELRESHTAMAWLLAALATAELFTFAGGGQGAMTVAMKRLRFPVLLNLPLAVANLLGSILLVAYTPLGVVGVAIPTLVVFIIRRIAETAYVTHITKVGLSRYLLRAYLPPVTTLLILTPAAFTLHLLIRPQSVPMLLLAAMLFGLSWVPVCWFVGFDQEDRRGFGRMVLRIGGKVFPRLGLDHKKDAQGQDPDPAGSPPFSGQPPESGQGAETDQDARIDP